MSNTIKWLWLTTKRGLSSVKISRLVEKYGSIEDIYSRTSYDVPHLTKEDTAALCNKSLDTAKRTYENVRSCGAEILTCDNKYYPESLRNIRPMPYVLYVRGRAMDIDNMFAIGIVGTRINTDYGAECASRISYELGKQGVVIVSGLAKGIDSIAMSAAIRAGAKTIGVLGCGIDQVYPASNRRLFDEVLKNGLIISEYPPGMLAFRGSFPQRNRIIAGLSRGVLVVEGSRSSGSMITARFAEEYSRDVFAVPRNIGDKNAHGIPMDGTDHLIQTGAKLIMSAADMLTEYGYTAPKIKSDSPPPEPPPEPDISVREVKAADPPPAKEITDTDIEALSERAASDMQKSIIRLIGRHELFADEIADELDADAAGIGTALTIMETIGLIKRQPDGRYKLNC